MLQKLLWLSLISLFFATGLCAQQLPFGISLPPSLNFTTSPNPVGSGARAVGQGTAFIGVADDATAASHNPAGLVQLQRPEASIVGSYFYRREDQDVTASNTVVEDQTLEDVNLNYLSAVYPFQLFRRNMVVSLNYQRLVDLQGNSDVTSRFETIDEPINGIQQVSSDQDGQLFTISPALAVQIIPTLSFGAAFNIWPDTSDNGWDQNVSVQGRGRVASGNRIVPFVSNGKINEDYDFKGFNVTFGVLWDINQMFSLGGVFRTPFTAKVNRSHDSSLTVTLQDGSPPVTTADSFSENLDMDFPISYGIGLAARLSDRLTLDLDVSRIHWSDFKLEKSKRDTLLVDNGAPSGKGQAVLNGESDDTTSVRLGAEYLWIRPKFIIPARAGVFYDPEPGDNGTDDFFGGSLGTGIAYKQFLFDMAYEFRTGKVESEATDTTVYQHNVLASVIYHF
jgi:long-chain fatty acid transport protein